MPRLEPFAGLRYDPAIPLDLVTAPPYDIVSPHEREVLASRHPANSIRVELPVEDVGSNADRYQVAADLLSSWQQQGILCRDLRDGFYPYRMTPPNGRTTIGVLGALACEAPGGNVLPHEETIPKDRSDRLDLLRASRANLSPIWGLSLTKGLSDCYQPVGPPAASAVDDDGVLHELWVLDSPDAMKAITAGVSESPVVIADGHHRWATAVTYQQERAAAGDSPGGQDFVLALIVELAEEQLTVGAVHRTVKVPRGIDVVAAFWSYFDLDLLSGSASSDLESLERQAETQGRTGELTLITTAGIWRLSPRPSALKEADSDLDSSIVALAIGAIGGASSTHHHGAESAIAELVSGQADAAILLRPVTVAQIAQWARARRCMPPKTTYFVPKPRTGMVFRLLDK